GPQSYPISFRPQPNTQLRNYNPVTGAIRPGAAPIVLNVTTSDAGTLAVDNPKVTFAPGVGSATVTARPVSLGPAVLTLEAPAGYLVDKAGAHLAVSVEGARLGLDVVNRTVGRDLQINGFITSEVRLPAAT